MTVSLLECISTADGIITDKWANGTFGKIVDIKNDGDFRFVDYKIGEDGLAHKCHACEADEMNCPIVVTGFVGYWLHNRKLGIRDLFASYYNHSMKKYEEEHQYDIDSWERDLKKEFACRKHVPAERKAIETSKAIFPFLSQSDVQYIERLATNYLAYARKKRKELYPPNYPKNEVIERTFIQPFTFGGTAYDCTNWMRTEYDLPFMRPRSKDHIPEKEQLEGKWKDYHEVESRIWIKDDFDDFDETVLTQMNGGMMEEIHENLKNCATYDDKLRYITSLVVPFKEFADAFYPKERIDNHKKHILELQEKIRYWETYKGNSVDPNTGKPINPQEQLDACKKSIEDYQKDIEYWKKVQDKFYWFAEHGLTKQFSEGEDHEMCQILGRWWNLMIFFASQLAALALTYKINLMDVQERCGVYLLWHMNIIDYVDDHYITSYEYAQKLLDEVEAESSKSEEAPKGQKGSEPKKHTTQSEQKKEEPVINAFDRLLDYKEDKTLDNYLSPKHWNSDVNHFIYNGFLEFYSGTELGKYLWANYAYDMKKPITDFSVQYGQLFNHAYHLCQMILSDEVPETKIAAWLKHFGKERAYDHFGVRTYKDSDGTIRDMNPVPNVIDMIGAYNIFGMAYCILVFSGEHNATTNRFINSISKYNDNGLPYCGYLHSFSLYYMTYTKAMVDVLTGQKKLSDSFDYKSLHSYLYQTFPWYIEICEALKKHKQQASSQKEQNKSQSRKQPQKTDTNKNNSNDKKPKTLKFFNHGNKGVLKEQKHRVEILFKKFKEWRWIDDNTQIEDFMSFFEGEPRHCNISWTSTNTTLTILLQELIKQPFIQQQTGCKARSLVRNQFDITPNSDRNRLDPQTEERIKLVLIILDTKNPLPEKPSYGTKSEEDITDSALSAVYEGHLRSTKGI